ARMNLGASAIVLRPRTLAEVLDLACRLCMSLAFGVHARLAAIVLLPILAGCLLLRYGAGWAWLDVWLVAAAAGSMVPGAFSVAVGRLIFPESLGGGQVLRLFVRRAGPYLGTLALSRLLRALAALPFLVGLPFVWPRQVFVHEASLLENAGVTDAMR